MNKIEKLTQAITDFFAEKGQHYGYDDETIKEMLRTIHNRITHTKWLQLSRLEPFSIPKERKFAD